MIVAANSSSTLITTFTLGATDTASSPVELVHNVPPAAYTTNASTLVSAGYFLYLGGTRLEIFNNSADILQPLHSFLLSDCEGPRRLAHGPGIFGTSTVHIVEAIALVECKTSVYALFPDHLSDFRLQKRLDVSTDTKASIAVLPRIDNTTIALVTRSGAPIVFSSNLDTGSFNPSPAFHPSSITCLSSAPPLQPYGKDEVILHCPNGPRYFCTPDSCESQPITNLNGVEKLQVAFNKDIAVVANSDSITVYRNRFTTMCSINATERQRFYLTVTSEATILILVNPTNTSLYNITNGCSPPITVLTTDSALRHNIIGRYLILTTANMYNVTIVDLITGERMYSVLLNQTPIVYQLRPIHSPPSLSPSPTTITNSTTSVPSVSSPPTLTSPVISTSSATSNIQPEHTSQSTPPTTSIIPISSTTSNAHSTSSLPSTTYTAIPTPTPTFESLPLSITAGVTAAAVILPVLLFISIIAILVHCARNRRDKNTFSSSQQTESVSSNGNAGVELVSLTKPTPETNCVENSTSTPFRYTTPYGTSVSSPSQLLYSYYHHQPYLLKTRYTDLSTAFTTV